MEAQQNSTSGTKPRVSTPRGGQALIILAFLVMAIVLWELFALNSRIDAARREFSALVSNGMESAGSRMADAGAKVLKEKLNDERMYDEILTNVSEYLQKHMSSIEALGESLAGYKESLDRMAEREQRASQQVDEMKTAFLEERQAADAIAKKAREVSGKLTEMKNEILQKLPLDEEALVVFIDRYHKTIDPQPFAVQERVVRDALKAKALLRVASVASRMNKEEIGFREGSATIQSVMEGYSGLFSTGEMAAVRTMLASISDVLEKRKRKRAFALLDSIEKEANSSSQQEMFRRLRVYLDDPQVFKRFSEVWQNLLLRNADSLRGAIEEVGAEIDRLASKVEKGDWSVFGSAGEEMNALSEQLGDALNPLTGLLEMSMDYGVSPSVEEGVKVENLIRVASQVDETMKSLANQFDYLASVKRSDDAERRMRALSVVGMALESMSINIGDMGFQRRFASLADSLEVRKNQLYDEKVAAEKKMNARYASEVLGVLKKIDECDIGDVRWDSLGSLGLPEKIAENIKEAGLDGDFKNKDAKLIMATALLNIDVQRLPRPAADYYYHVYGNVNDEKDNYKVLSEYSVLLEENGRRLEMAKGIAEGLQCH